MIKLQSNTKGRKSRYEKLFAILLLITCMLTGCTASEDATLEIKLINDDTQVAAVAPLPEPAEEETQATITPAEAEEPDRIQSLPVMLHSCPGVELRRQLKREG